MAINKATLAKEVSGVVEYIYPKTDADIVEYSSDVSVREKIDTLESSVTKSISDLETTATSLSDDNVTMLANTKIAVIMRFITGMFNLNTQGGAYCYGNS